MILSQMYRYHSQKLSSPNYVQKLKSNYRAVASLTVPGGQDYFPLSWFPLILNHFISNFPQIILFIYLFIYLFFFFGFIFPLISREGPGYATVKLYKETYVILLYPKEGVITRWYSHTKIIHQWRVLLVMDKDFETSLWVTSVRFRIFFLRSRFTEKKK